MIRLEASILLLFFVLYMALMIFSAHNSKKHNHYNHSDSGNSSLSSSYNSSCADSAIAGCTDPASRRNSVSRSRANKPAASRLASDPNNNSLQVPTSESQQQILGQYGQFYFAVKPADSPNKVSEKTPLVLANHQQQPHSPVYHHYHSDDNEFSMTRQANQVDEASIQGACKDECCVTVDLGAVAIKNSACLSNSLRLEKKFKNNFDDDDSIGELKRLQALDEESELLHEENWVSTKWILVPMLPLTLSMKILTPCKFKNTFWTIWTFVISVALIGALTYVSVCMVSMLGQVIGIPETVAGMTILSWGTGIPELIASIVLIKKTAKADMAICNTIGSNVIDVSFCLSLPW